VSALGDGFDGAPNSLVRSQRRLDFASAFAGMASVSYASRSDSAVVTISRPISPGA
jgi:hypothetical protein